MHLCLFRPTSFFTAPLPPPCSLLLLLAPAPHSSLLTPPPSCSSLLLFLLVLTGVPPPALPCSYVSSRLLLDAPPWFLLVGVLDSFCADLAPLVVASLYSSSAGFPDVPDVPNTVTKVASNTIKLNELAGLAPPFNLHTNYF